MISGDKTTLFLPIGEVLTVTASADALGRVTRLRSPGNEPYSPVAINGANLTFGPYNVVAMFRVECDAGSVALSHNIDDPALLHTIFDAYTATAATVNALSALLNYGAGVPVDYTDGTPPATGEGTAPAGSLYIDITNGFVYRNSGSQAQPAWTKLADAA